MPDRDLWIRSGIAGVLGVACYILAIAVPWPETQWGISTALLVVCAWPILSIVYSYGLCSFIAAERESRGLGRPWAIPSAALGVALIGLNAATFPWPPADRGLVDIGPFIGLFVMALAARLAWLGRHGAS